MKFIYLFFTALLAVSNLLLAQEDTEELIVTSAFIEGDVSSINNPIHVVDYTEVSKRGILKFSATMYVSRRFDQRSWKLRLLIEKNQKRL